MKTFYIVCIALFSCMVMVIGCKKTTKAPTLIVGSSYGGGIIAYLLQPGDPGYNSSMQHGLIAAPSDQSSGIEWGVYGTPTYASGTALGTGLANTDSIVKYCGSGTAAYLCHILTLGGYTDWYLPSKDELSKLYIFSVNQQAIAGFASAVYWSSTENDSSYYFAWVQAFYNGDQYYYYKANTYYVRAVRAF